MNQITYSHGFFFPPGLRVFGISIILFSIALIYSYGQFPLISIIACLLIFIGLAFFAKKYLQIVKEENKIIFLTSWLGLKQKRSKSLEEFCHISVIGQQYSVTSATWLSNKDLSFKDSFYKYNIVLLNKNHLRKQLISSFDSHKEALTEAENLSNILGFEIVNFNPVNTRTKRNRLN